MKIKSFLYLALCFVIGTFLGYKIAEGPSEATPPWAHEIKEMENQELAKLETTQNREERIELVKKIHEKIFSLLLADVAINLDTKAWLKLIDEQKNLLSCTATESTALALSASDSQVASPTMTPVSTENENLTTNENTSSETLSASSEEDSKKEVLKDLAPFVDSKGKLLRPTTFLNKSQLLSAANSLLEKLKGERRIKIYNANQKSKIWNLKLKSKLQFVEHAQHWQGSSELELKDEKNIILGHQRSQNENKFFASNPNLPQELVVLTSATSFVLLSESSKGKYIAKLYLRKNDENRYSYWGSSREAKF